MKNTLSTHEAVNLLLDDTFAGWSRKGAFALVEHIEQMEEESGTEIEFDCVAIRCEWHEYGSPEEIARDYLDANEIEGKDESEIEEIVKDYLENHTVFIKVSSDCWIVNTAF